MPRRAGRPPAAPADSRRRNGRHCPLCLAVLPRISGGAGARSCTVCGGGAVSGPRCSRCHEESVWQGERGAACASCGHHGSRVAVIAGHGWLSDDDEEP